MSEQNKFQRQDQSQYDDIPSAHKIASMMSTKQFIMSEETRLLNQWEVKSNQLFNYAGDVFLCQYDHTAQQLINGVGGDNERLYAKCKKEFEAYCILNRKVQKKSEEIQNFAALFNSKNSKRAVFAAWKEHCNKKKYLRRMDEKAEKYHENRKMKMCLKYWLAITMNNTKSKIKKDVLDRTQVQISKIQTQYESLIRNLQETLEKRLNELRKEEEQHKVLHDKYQSMYMRSKAQGVPTE